MCFRKYNKAIYTEPPHPVYLFQARLGERMTPMASGVWRYKELICPELVDEHIVTRYEGNTGLYRVDAIEHFVGIRQVWVKAQSENPSGSFKDNGMTVTVSMGKSLGFKKFACRSQSSWRLLNHLIGYCQIGSSTVQCSRLSSRALISSLGICSPMSTSTSGTSFCGVILI